MPSVKHIRKYYLRDAAYLGRHITPQIVETFVVGCSGCCFRNVRICDKLRCITDEDVDYGQGLIWHLRSMDASWLLWGQVPNRMDDMFRSKSADEVYKIVQHVKRQNHIPKNKTR